MSDDTDILLEKAERGELGALDELLERYRGPLRLMVHVHFDRRLLSRADPSDVVQDTLMTAHNNLPAYLEKREPHFFAWLRSIAKCRLIDLHRRHVTALGRSVQAEVNRCDISDLSVDFLAKFVKGHVGTPSEHLAHEEELQQVRAAFNCLNEDDREVLTLRYLERVPIKQAAAMFQISVNAFTKRHLRALQRLRSLLP